MQQSKNIAKWALLAAALLFAGAAIAQVFTRDFRQSQESPYHHGTTYRCIEVSEQDQYYNIYWKSWLIDDIRTFEEDNILDMKTQEGMNNDGYFASATTDSIYFNHAAAMRACPSGWRLPRIGEYDTLMKSITYDQRAYMFSKLGGFRGYSADSLNGSATVKTQILRGGFWWCWESKDAERAFVIKVGDSGFYEVGLADIKDLASVRCVKDDWRREKQESSDD